MKVRGSSSAVPSGGCLKALALFGGVGVLCITALLIEPAIHVAGVWWQRDSYVRTEMEILALNLRMRKSNASGRVVMSDEKWSFQISDFNNLLVKDGVPLQTKDELQGFRVPVWYHPEGRTWFFRHLRVVPAYPNKPLPDGKAVLGQVTLVGGGILAGVLLIWAGLDKTGRGKKQPRGKGRRP